MPLLYLPETDALFLWGEAPSFALGDGVEATAELVVPAGRRTISGTRLPLLSSVVRLAGIAAASVSALPPSIASWALASKLAIELVARERVVPNLARRNGRIEARWAVALSLADDAAKLAAIARAMPPAAHALPIASDDSQEIWTAEALLREFLDAVADALVRSTQGAPPLPAAKTRPSWQERWRTALTGPEDRFEAVGFAERTLLDDLERWSAPARGARDRLRACFRLELPEADGDAFTLRFLLQSPDDPSLLVSAEDIWRAPGRSLETFGRAFRDPQESLLEALGRAARLFTPIAHALAEGTPAALSLDAAAAWTFLSDGASALAEAGFGVIVPSELTQAGQRRLRLRMRVGSNRKVAGQVAGASGLALDALLEFAWEAAIGDTPLSARELSALAKHKAPLVRHRGAWVAIDPRELAEIQARIARGPGQISVREGLRLALAGEVRDANALAAVRASGSLAELLQRIAQAASIDLPPPAALRAELRPYQTRGLAWLSSHASLGLGACLADDMGLGKTIQLLAFLLRRRESAPDDRRPALLVAPTSVVGNWEREAERFTPSLILSRHYGSERARSADPFRGSGALVVTTYGVLRRDASLLAEIDWSTVALDEAQNIKNAASATAAAARGLRASHRFALTGTPVENRLAELWSILEFANPGLLGSLEAFRRDYAVPIERYASAAAAERLRRIVGPFVLRRLKSDPAVIADLPAKQEMNVVCTLTREQATLYKAVVDEELRRIEGAEGVERRGRVLALLLHLKQICNHPAQYLSERAPLAERSGKLARLTEMLDEALAAGDKALVFTQFREMGERLQSHLRERLGIEVCFLHGGTSKRARDLLVQRFQEEREPRVFVLSLKAGGTGLNLTAANHVFHYDRWWNPAVEDQATDRAYRIGQTRRVQVHKLLCAGTIEEKVNAMLEQKRGLATSVVGSEERFITELDDAELRDLFALSSDASVSGDERDDSSSEPAAISGKKRRRGKVSA